MLLVTEGTPPEGVSSDEPYLVVERRFVTTGERRDGLVVVLDGLEGGEQVITAGQLKLDSGTHVAIAEPHAQAGRRRAGVRISGLPLRRQRHIEQFQGLAHGLHRSFIRRPVLASVISLLIVLLGIQAFNSLTIRQYPQMESALITVTTAYPGANAETIQGYITQPLQQSLASAEGWTT